MKKIKIIYTICLSFLLVLGALAQNSTKFSAVITDEEGIPLSGVIVYYNEGSKVALTDAEGKVDILIESDSKILLDLAGYKEKTVSVLEMGVSKIVLVKEAAGTDNSSKIYVPFGQTYQRYMPGASTTITADELIQYDSKQSVYSALYGRVPGFWGTGNRGIGSALVVVDGIPRPAVNVPLSEVENITILNDGFSRALYGSQAENGLVIVTTKRGEANKRVLNVRAEQSMSTVISMPEYLNAADYMEYYNQAASNDELPARYDQLTIDNTRRGDNPVLYPDVDFYSSDYLKNTSSSSYISLESSGGNDNTQYYISGGMNSGNSIIKVGEGENERNNGFNLRGNIDVKVNDYIKMNVDGIAAFSFDRSPLNNYFSHASSTLPNAYPALIDTALLSSAQQAGAEGYLIDGRYVPGGTTVYTENFLGDLNNGYIKTNQRILQANIGLDLNLNKLVEGLTGKAYLTFDGYNLYSIKTNNTYAVYQPIIGQDSTGADSLYFNTIGVNKKQQNLVTNVGLFYRRIGIFGSLDYQKRIGDLHRIALTGIAYTDQTSMEGSLQSEKNVTFGLRLNYALADKYVLEGALVAPGSNVMPVDQRFGFSPSAGIGWIISDEDFLSGVAAINYMKIYANLGSIKTSKYNDFYQGDTYYPGSGNYFYNFGKGKNPGRTTQLGNPELGWASLNDLNIGFESRLMDNQLTLDAAYFSARNMDLPLRLTNTYPAYVQIPYENFGEYKTSGVQFNLNLKQQMTSDFTVNLGFNGYYSKTIAVEENVLAYAESNRQRTGQPSDARFGLQFDRYYTEDDFINGELDPTVADYALPTFGEVKPGDLKYKDTFKDGVIDAKDEGIIGYASPSTFIGIHISLKYKEFELFALGTGVFGQDLYKGNTYYQIYGNNKYSVNAKEAWTPTLGDAAEYPRLSTQRNNNNLQTSDFWQYKADRFTLNTLQLTYTAPFATAQRFYMKGLQVYLRGSNLLMIAKNKDILQLNTTSQPQMRNYALGINVNF